METPTSTSLTIVFTIELLFSLFGSALALEIVAVLLKVVPLAVPPGICAVNVKAALAPAVKLKIEQLTLPPLPTGGVVHDQPAGALKLTKVRPAGRGSCMITDAAASGPPLVASSE